MITRVLETKLESSARTANVLDHWVISPAPKKTIFNLVDFPLEEVLR